MDFQSLIANYAALRRVAFVDFSERLVLGDGDPNSNLMLIGEAPGAEEDAQLKPFVGRSGRLLTEELKRVNLDRSQYYIANIIPWRPPQNRTPTNAEIALALPLLMQHIALIDPKLIVAIGSTALRALGVQDTISVAQGNVYKVEYEQRILTVFCIYHPSFILRQARKKTDLQASLQKLCVLMNELID